MSDATLLWFEQMHGIRGGDSTYERGATTLPAVPVVLRMGEIQDYNSDGLVVLRQVSDFVLLAESLDALPVKHPQSGDRIRYNGRLYEVLKPAYSQQDADGVCLVAHAMQIEDDEMEVAGDA